MEKGPSESTGLDTGVEQGETQRESKGEADLVCGRNSPKHKDQEKGKDQHDH